MSVNDQKKVIIIGGGPAGLMAAEYLSANNFAVTIYDRKKTFSRKFLLAGRGGLNLTHSENIENFLTRYGPAHKRISAWLDTFGPTDMREWAEKLGEDTFIGSSGRVFPKSFKASPLLRAWLQRLADQDVVFKPGYLWTGSDEKGGVSFTTEDGEKIQDRADAYLLALGGASWPNLGSDGTWVKLLEQNEISVSPLKPANCGFAVNWSDIFREKFSGSPVKSIAISCGERTVNGEIMIDKNGIEGGAIYALSASLRNTIERDGHALLHIDLRPTLTLKQLEQKLSTPRKNRSFSSYLRNILNLTSIETGLIYEAERNAAQLDALTLANLIKAIPLTLISPFGIDRAISTAGGVQLTELNDGLMLTKHPGLFIAGEMIDWEAPTGGYLLQAAMASGLHAAKGIENYLSRD